MKKLFLLALLFTFYHAHGQLKVAFQVDTTLQKNKSLYEFVNSYFNQTSINNTSGILNIKTRPTIITLPIGFGGALRLNK